MSIDLSAVRSEQLLMLRTSELFRVDRLKDL
jgi:hypothetical protein